MAKLRESLKVVLLIHHGDEFKGGSLKGINVADWCESAPKNDIFRMAESYSLLDF
jgi:hypothetical protein